MRPRRSGIRSDRQELQALMTHLDSFVQTLSPGLIRKRESYWTTPAELSDVHYPADAHQAYVAIEDRSYWFAHRNRCIVSAMRRFPPSGPILDVGGGNGVVSAALAAAGFPCIVLEPGPRGAEAARARGLPVIQSTLEDAGLRPESVPAVGMFDVLEHIPADRETLAALHRLLRPRGRLFLSVPALRWLWSNEDTAAGHARRYTRRSLAERLRGAGFEVESMAYMFCPLVLPVLLLRTLPSLAGRIEKPPRPPEADHILPRGWIGRTVSRMLDAEYGALTRGARLPIGTSVLAVASKL
jgi:2-polyprenyl-3-methyl-5-hydroxy-6-metoxy-1,4-benzoquinol methylase